MKQSSICSLYLENSWRSAIFGMLLFLHCPGTFLTEYLWSINWSIFSANVQFFFQRVRRDIQHISRVYDIQCYISLERWRLNLSISKVFFKKNLERYFVWPRVVNCRIWVFQPIHFQPLRFSCGSSELEFSKSILNSKQKFIIAHK